MTATLWAVTGVYLLMFAVFVSAALFFKFRYRFLKGRVRVRILDENGIEHVKIIKRKLSDASFDLTINGSEVKYNIRQDRTIRTGGEEMPTLIYTVGDAEPKDITGKASPVNSMRFREVATNKLVTDLLSSFKKTVIDNGTALIITVAVILGVTLILGIFINTKFDELLSRFPQTTGNSSGEVIR